MKRFALAGNPNCGKTTLFNCLTGSTAHVGNWPGVTVDKREGVYKKLEENISIIDLPGIYSLSPYTPEEVISRNYVLEEKPDCVINIVDVTNLERNLYLTTQILEIDVPMVIALNMMDTLEKQGDSINEVELEKRLEIPVVKISALKGVGLDELMQKAYKASKEKRKAKTVLEGTDINHLIRDVRIALEGHNIENPLFHAIKLVERDELEVQMHPNTVKMVEEFKNIFTDELFGDDYEALVADARYKYITKNYSPLMTKKRSTEYLSKSDKADKVLTNKWAGIPLFLIILFSIFHLTFGSDLFYISAICGGLPTLEELGMADTFGRALLACFYDGAVFTPGVILFNLMSLICETLFGYITLGLQSLGASDWVISLVGDGILGGLGSVLSFVPQIITLLLFLSILEDTGYMARVAFILDRIFRKFGISGRAFIPMIMGFGCSVPAMINTRTLIDERERTLTLRTIPFFCCGAKLPILTAVAGAVASILGLGDGSVISFSMYVLGMAIAVLSIILMRSTTQRGEVSPFIMELPSYHVPSFKALMIHLWDKTVHYLKKVFTVILASTIVLWFLSNYGWNWKPVDVISSSILASIGQLLQPLFTPLGFGSQLNEFGWVFIVAALTGLIAKEEVIATFGTLGAIFTAVVIPELTADGATDVMLMVVGTGITWQALISFMIFNLTTIPCFGAVAAAKGETKKGQFKWTLLFWVATSYIVSSLAYVILSWWWTIFIVLVLGVGLIFALKHFNKKYPIKPLNGVK